jgi:hypothetical protein
MEEESLNKNEEEEFLNCERDFMSGNRTKEEEDDDLKKADIEYVRLLELLTNNTPPMIFVYGASPVVTKDI